MEGIEAYEGILKFLDMMNGDWGWVPIIPAMFITALIMDFLSKLKDGR